MNPDNAPTLCGSGPRLCGTIREVAEVTRSNAVTLRVVCRYLSRPKVVTSLLVGASSKPRSYFPPSPSPLPLSFSSSAI